HGRSPQRDLRSVSCLLSEVAGCVAVSFWGTSRTGIIEEIDVVPLVGSRALVVMTLRDRSTLMQPITLEAITESDADMDAELRRLRERLRALCRGRTLADARDELER